MQVISVKYKPGKKVYRLANDKRFTAQRFCCLGVGDDVVISSADSAEVKCRNGRAQIFPYYAGKDSLTLGNRNLPLLVKEIETDEELAGYQQLKEYHYRGTTLFGRRVPLIVTSNDPLLPLVLGYIELATTFIMNRPRAVLLDNEFHDNGSEITWTNWRKDAVQQYTNLIVRIARTVVSPEFRGLGLARVLVKHASRFAKQHWHVGGLKPLFLEITADMLRYIPFVESAGMHYIGDTQGNLSRVSEDMDYLLKNFSRIKKEEILKEDSAGIVDLQVFYATRLKEVQKTEGVTREHLLKLLLRSPHRLSDDNWGLLHRIFRLPKPTFLIGLNSDTEKFVQKRIRDLGLPIRYPAYKPPEEIRRLASPIEIKECSLDLSSRLVRTRATRKIQQAFGVNRDMLTTTLFAKINFTIKPGDIVLICGPSGAGKTTLLSLLDRHLRDKQEAPQGMGGTIDVPTGVIVNSLSPLGNSRPLVNSLGRVSFEHALFALNVSGLAEANLYVKRFRELSNGQRYRAMVAKLIASQANVWLADEFCATLDPITANIVSRNLRRCAKQLGVTVILASANWAEFVHELKPDTIVHLRAPWDSRVFSWKEFNPALDRSRSMGQLRRGRVSQIKSGRKNS